MKRLSLVLLLLCSLFYFVAPGQVDAQVTQSWAERYQGPGSGTDNPSAVAIDPSGNIVVTGLSMSGGYATEDFTTIKYSPAGDTLWMRRLNGTGGGTDAANGLVIDAEGNIHVTGASWSSGSAYDYLTVKYNPSGDTLWTRRYNGPRNGGDIAHAIAIDDSGNVCVTGESEGSIGTHGIFEDFATVKYSADGSLQWVARYNGPAGDFDAAVSLAVDESENVYVTGTSDGGSSGSGSPYLDFATIKYNALGSVQWVQRYNGPGSASDEATGVAVDAMGFVYVTGTAHDDLSDSDITTIRYSSAGDIDWVAVFNGTGNDADESAGLSLNDSGELFVAGKTYRGPGEGFDFVTIRYEETGDTSWVRFYDGPAGGYDRAVALAVHDAGSVVITGVSAGVTTGEDFATLKYSATGELEWEMRYTYDGAAGSSEVPCDVAIDPSGNVYVTGMSALDYATVMYAETTTEVDLPETGKPSGFELFQNYPNPFNPETNIRLQIADYGLVALRVYDLLGRSVAELVNENKAPGTYDVTWDATGMPSGVYFYTLNVTTEGTGEEFSSTRSLMLLR